MLEAHSVAYCGFQFFHPRNINRWLVSVAFDWHSMVLPALCCVSHTLTLHYIFKQKICTCRLKGRTKTFNEANRVGSPTSHDSAHQKQQCSMHAHHSPYQVFIASSNFVTLLTHSQFTCYPTSPYLSTTVEIKHVCHLKPLYLTLSSGRNLLAYSTFLLNIIRGVAHFHNFIHTQQAHPRHSLPPGEHHEHIQTPQSVRFSRSLPITSRKLLCKVTPSFPHHSSCLPFP